MTRFRFAWRLAVRRLTRSRQHAVLVVAAIAVPLMVATAGMTAARSSELSPIRELEATVGPAASAFVDAYQWPDLVQSPGGAVGPRQEEAAISEPAVSSYEDRLQAVLASDQQLHRWTGMSARWATSDVRYRDGGALVEADLGDPGIAQAIPLASGHLPTRAGQVVIDHALAVQLDIGVGSTLTVSAPPGYQDGAATLPTTRVTVVGVASPVPGAIDRLVGFALPGTALASPETVQGSPGVRWLITGGPVTWAQVQAINAIGSVVMSRAVLTSPPPRDQVSYADAGSSLALGDWLALQLTGVGVLGLIALLVAPAFTVSARRARHDLGLLAATGARRADLWMAVGLQGVSAGMTATAIGMGSGLLVAAAFRLAVHVTGSVAMPDLRIPWGALAVVAVIGVVGPTLAAWWPARQAAREDPVLALAQRPDAPGRRRTPTSSALATVAIGTLGAGAGVVTHSAAVLAGGSLILLGGILLTLGPLIGWVATAAPHLATAGRYALRDADRHRARTVPAVAGVLAACTLAVATGAFVTSLDAHDEATYNPPSGRGTIRVSIADLPSGNGGPVVEPSAAQWAAMEQSLRDHLELEGAVLPVYVGVAVGADAGPSGVWIDPVSAGTVLPPTDSTLAYPATWQPATQPNAPLVDDGTLIARSGLRGAAEAAAALAAGRVVVAQAGQIWADGSARFDVAHATTSGEVTVPATVVDLGADRLRLIVPPSLAGRFSLTIVQVGLLATTTTLPDQDTQNTADAALRAVVPGITLVVERGPKTSGGIDLAILLGATVFLALASAGMCAALAAADSVPDLATLAAVGARRRLRRMIAATQTGVITLLGVWLGTPIGLLFAAALVTVRRYEGATGEDSTWQLHPPWALLALVLLAIPAVTLAGAWLLTPERLPTTRRAGT